MNSLFIDPGSRGIGIALFRDKTLFAAQYVKNPLTKGDGPESWRRMADAARDWATDKTKLSSIQQVVIELPRVYPGPQQKGDQNDLIQIACVAAMIARSFPGADLTSYYPRDWKGNVPADLMLERIMAKLSNEEAERLISVGAKDHNAIDACGIGLHHLGRLKPTRIFPR